MPGAGVASRAPVGDAADLRGLRVLVTHEWLYTWAGAERCLEQILHVFPRADLLVGVVAPHMRDYNDVTRRAEETWVGRLPGARTRHRWFLPLHAAAFAAHDTSEYDLVVSSSHAFEKFVRPGHATHLCYCYSPPRFLWSDVYAGSASLAGKLALAGGGFFWRALDRRAARGVDRFVSISRHVADRVRRAYGVDSDVVYPPVSAKPVSAVSGPPETPYLLSMGRLVEYKRTDLAILAARRIGMKLLVVGDGPERSRLERIAGPETEFLGEVPEARAGQLLEGCAAFVFAAEEDFGIAPLEANAHGRPVVCLDRGGVTETMVANRTAVFFGQQTPGAVATAIADALGRSWNADVLRANAARFSPEVFRRDFATAARSALSG